MSKVARTDARAKLIERVKDRLKKQKQRGLTRLRRGKNNSGLSLSNAEPDRSILQL
jgi:hypothetical protein